MTIAQTVPRQPIALSAGRAHDIPFAGLVRHRAVPGSVAESRRRLDLREEVAAAITSKPRAVVSKVDSRFWRVLYQRNLVSMSDTDA